MMISLLTKEDTHAKLYKKLEDERILSKEQIKDITREKKKTNRPLVEIVFDRTDHKPHRALLKQFGKHYEVPSVILNKKTIVPYVLNLIPKEIAEQHGVIIFKKRKDTIHVATTDPQNDQTIEFIKKKTGLKPKLYVTSPREIHNALKRYHSEIRTEFAKILEDSVRASLELNETTEKLAHHVPIIKMVDTIIEHALEKKASDVHIEPTSEEIVVRFRIDGLLRKIVLLPREIQAPLLTRIKIMANLKIDEHRAPQDGRFKFNYQDRRIAIRTSVIPTLNGAKIVLRLLDMKEKEFTLNALGLNKQDLTTLKKEITKPHGMILVTGPTGSGKTTTLYALLRLLNKEDTNISTIEDPIEYGIEGINQTQINPAAGLTFANGLRSLLRQDPNILMVGEIRDVDTASIALNAAMTGHLVLSTLHTNNAYLAIQRLTEMGVQPFMAASVINIVIAQRLVRTICPDCKARIGTVRKYREHYDNHFKLNTAYQRLQANGLVDMKKDLDSLSVYTGKGCDTCNQTGYRGRLGIYEVLTVDREMHDTILESPNADAIRKKAASRRALSMSDDGLLKVVNGDTTFDEVIRVTKE